jgi:choline dehydrogenase-like flavoprotein
MSPEYQFDVIIIGTGAGGGTLAHHLALSGKRILMLERGAYVTREKHNWNRKAVNADAKYNTKELWRDVDGRNRTRIQTITWAGTRKFTVQHCSAWARRIWARFATMAESHRPGRSLPCGLTWRNLVELFKKPKSKVWFDFTVRGKRFRGSNEGDYACWLRRWLTHTKMAA